MLDNKGIPNAIMTSVVSRVLSFQCSKHTAYTVLAHKTSLKLTVKACRDEELELNASPQRAGTEASPKSEP